MCSVQILKKAEEDLSRLPEAEREKLEQDLFDLAAADSCEAAQGLALVLDPIRSWRGTELRDVAHWRKGRHRCYLKGHHTRCTYFLCFVNLNKDAKDREEDLRFQRRVLKGLQSGFVRQLDSTTT